MEERSDSRILRRLKKELNGPAETRMMGVPAGMQWPSILHSVTACRKETGPVREQRITSVMTASKYGRDVSVSSNAEGGAVDDAFGNAVYIEFRREYWMSGLSVMYFSAQQIDEAVVS